VNISVLFAFSSSTIYSVDKIEIYGTHTSSIQFYSVLPKHCGTKKK